MYRKPSRLQMFVSDFLDWSLESIAAPDALGSLCHEVIEEAKSQVRLDDLYDEFCRENRRYRLPQAIAAQNFADAVELDRLNLQVPSERKILDAMNTLLTDARIEHQGRLRDRLALFARDRSAPTTWKNDSNIAYVATYLHYYTDLAAEFRERCATYLQCQNLDPAALKSQLPPAPASRAGALRHILVKIDTEAIALDDTTEVQAWIYAVGDPMRPYRDFQTPETDRATGKYQPRSTVTKRFRETADKT